ncbi:Protein of unknown function [Leuconostoc citreum LBAE E16]|nr:Protein of unknown function [Leuconostoc citreum LBAE E16]
MKKAYQ